MRDVYRSATAARRWVANGVNSTKIPTNPNPRTRPSGHAEHEHLPRPVLVQPDDPRRSARPVAQHGVDRRRPRLGRRPRTAAAPGPSRPGGCPASSRPSATRTPTTTPRSFKMTGTPTIILGNDGGLNVSEDDGATFSSDKNNELVTHLYLHGGRQPGVPNLVIGGTQDNGTRVCAPTTAPLHNQVIGGDGMGTAYSQANTNTVIGSSQGSGMRTNLSNNPPDVFQNWVAGDERPGRRRLPASLPRSSRRRRSLDPTGRVFFHFSNARVWRTNNGGLNWILIGSATRRPAPSPGFPPARAFRSTPYNLGVSPHDLNRIAVGAGGGVPRHHHQRRRDLDRHRPDRQGARLPGLRHQRHLAGQPGRSGSPRWRRRPVRSRVIKATIASPATAGRRPRSRRCRTVCPTCRSRASTSTRATRRGHASTPPRTSASTARSTAARLGAVRHRPADRARQRHLHAAGRRLHAHRHLRPRHLGAAAARAGRARRSLDDGTSCDRDGVLDNGETGNLYDHAEEPGRRTT